MKNSWNYIVSFLVVCVLSKDLVSQIQPNDTSKIQLIRAQVSSKPLDGRQPLFNLVESGRHQNLNGNGNTKLSQQKSKDIQIQTLPATNFLQRPPSIGLWSDDIPVIVGQNHERNPALLSIINDSTSSQLIIAAEEWLGTTIWNRIILRSTYNFGKEWLPEDTLFINDPNGSIGYPQLAQLSDTSFILVFSRIRSNIDYDIFFTTIRNDFTPLITMPINETPIDHQWPALTSDYAYYPANAYLYLIYYQVEGPTSRIIFQRSTDGGLHWSSLELGQLNTPDFPHCSISFADNKLAAAFTYKSGSTDDIAIITSSNRGESWETFSTVAYTNKRETFPEIRVVDSNYIFMIYELWYTYTDRDIYYSYSEDGGDNWEINNLMAFSDDDERHPQLAHMQETLDLHAVYANVTQNQILRTETIFFVPDAWAEPENIKNNATELSVDYPLDISAQKTILGQPGLAVTWSQNNSVSDDIYFNASWFPMNLTISGYVKESTGQGIEGVVMSGLPHAVSTDISGFYSDTIHSEWKGMVKPAKTGWYFDPQSILYNKITSSISDQNYIGIRIYTIAGYVKDDSGTPVDLVVMQGLPGNPQTDTTGFYTANVPQGWSGTVIPNREGFYFTPQFMTYNSVNSHQDQQNFIASVIYYPISGHVRDNSGKGIAGVVMNGLPSSPQTNNNGFYIANVVHGWSGTVVPQKEGLYFSPSTRSYTNLTDGQLQQDYIASTILYTISGAVNNQMGTPLENVMLEGLPDNPVTDSSGFYIDSVPQNWIGTVTPVLEGSKFQPTHRSYSNVNADLTQENYTASILYVTISGFVKDTVNLPISDVLLNGLPGVPTTDTSGFYSDSVPYGWNGTVTPKKNGLFFSPASKSYTNVTTNQDSQNYIASTIQFTISGMVTDKQGIPVSNVLLGGLPGNPTTIESGFYSDKVPQNWSGTVTPVRTGLKFKPPSRSYSNVSSDKTTENYTASVIYLTLSGYITDNKVLPVSGVQLNGLPHTPFTDSSGFYRDSVEYGWSGTVSPVKSGLLFSPRARLYSNLTTDQIQQNFISSTVQYAISGIIQDENETKVSGVTMLGLPGNPQTDPGGQYVATVPNGWYGTVIPSLLGRKFSPSSRIYTNVNSSLNDENYFAFTIYFNISGFVKDSSDSPIEGVTLNGLPHVPVTDLSGFYSDSVRYDWHGQVNPFLSGYIFIPQYINYDQLTGHLQNQNYLALIISGLDDKSHNIPKRYFLYHNYPNPFNPRTRIRYEIPQMSEISIKIYNIIGLEIAVLLQKTQQAGVYEIDWDASRPAGIPSGVYFLRFKAGNYEEVRKMLYIR